jgi:hypothetical protein
MDLSFFSTYTIMISVHNVRSLLIDVLKPDQSAQYATIRIFLQMLISKLAIEMGLLVVFLISYSLMEGYFFGMYTISSSPFFSNLKPKIF